MKCCRNFADNLENAEILIFQNLGIFQRKLLNFDRIACHFDGVVFRGFLSIPRILTELLSEKFEWFGPSPIEPFNPARDPSRRASGARSCSRGRGGRSCRRARGSTGRSSGGLCRPPRAGRSSRSCPARLRTSFLHYSAEGPPGTPTLTLYSELTLGLCTPCIQYPPEFSRYDVHPEQLNEINRLVCF